MNTTIAGIFGVILMVFFYFIFFEFVFGPIISSCIMEHKHRKQQEEREKKEKAK